MGRLFKLKMFWITAIFLSILIAFYYFFRPVYQINRALNTVYTETINSGSQNTDPAIKGLTNAISKYADYFIYFHLNNEDSVYSRFTNIFDKIIADIMIKEPDFDTKRKKIFLIYKALELLEKNAPKNSGKVLIAKFNYSDILENFSSKISDAEAGKIYRRCFIEDCGSYHSGFDSSNIYDSLCYMLHKRLCNKISKNYFALPERTHISKKPCVEPGIIIIEHGSESHYT